MKKIYFTSFLLLFLLINIIIQAPVLSNGKSLLPGPEINHTPIHNTARVFWPALVYANVLGNPGIDSVWVRWYKNNTATGIRTFKLTASSGGNYSGLFNSDTNQVAFNDSIYYRIIAQDNSSGHVKDSTYLYSFKITAETFVALGSGTSAIGYPFYTFYMDSRTQMLYTASEIAAAGGYPNFLFNKIGFKILTLAAQVMNGFSIKVQNTTAASLTGFINSGWTEVYFGPYVVPAPGIQFIDFTTPFIWTGNNLLFEICFHNTFYTSNSTVPGTSVPNLCWHLHLDNNNGCALTPGTTYAVRPNIFLNKLNFVGNQNNGTALPGAFSLAQNYPNPFNPVTTINYQLPKNSHVKLFICDVLGREIQVLVNEKQTAGSYNVEWDASDYPSGVYFYRLNAGEYNDVKKMVLIK